MAIGKNTEFLSLQNLTQFTVNPAVKATPISGSPAYKDQ